MKKILIALFFCPLYIFANDIDVNGQFVIAPISSENCEGVAITEPTSGLSSDSQLLEMLMSFLTFDGKTSGIDNIIDDGYNQDDIVAIYSLSGQKQHELKCGINIVIDSKGQARKIFVE